MDILKPASELSPSEIAENLINNKQLNPAGDIRYAIQMASYFGLAPVVEILLQRVDPTDEHEWAIKNAGTEEIKDLLKQHGYKAIGVGNSLIVFLRQYYSL